MDRFPEKLRSARKAKMLSQTELAEVIGVTQRSMTNYERGCAIPRESTLRKIANALNVTVEYLTNDEVDNPGENRKIEEQADTVREELGNQAAKELEEVLQRGCQLFAGGNIDEKAMDVFFETLTEAYFESKRRAREKFTPKKLRGKE